MENLNLDSLHTFAEIVDGVFEDNNPIVVEYYLNIQSGWRNLSNQMGANKRNTFNKSTNVSVVQMEHNKSIESRSNEIHGCTKKSLRDTNNQFTFNHLFEVNLRYDRQSNDEIKDQKESHEHLKNDSSDKDDKVSNLNNADIEDANNSKIVRNERQLQSDWPYFELRVWSVESKRKRFIGLAFLDLPTKAGQYHQKIDIWSLVSSHPKTKLMQHFLGYSIEPNARLLTNKNDWRISLNSHVVGCSSIKLNIIICRRAPTYLNESEELDAIEEKIVVVAFRDARRRMQTLLKEKENIKPQQLKN